MRPTRSHTINKLQYHAGNETFAWDRKTRTWVSFETQTSYASISNMRKYSNTFVMRNDEEINRNAVQTAFDALFLPGTFPK